MNEPDERIDIKSVYVLLYKVISVTGKISLSVNRPQGPEKGARRTR